MTRGERLDDSGVVRIAKMYDKTPAQILVRWSLQHDLVVIPKSSHEKRILENSQVFDFHINQKEMEILDSLNKNLHTVSLD